MLRLLKVNKSLEIHFCGAKLDLYEELGYKCLCWWRHYFYLNAGCHFQFACLHNAGGSLQWRKQQWAAQWLSHTGVKIGQQLLCDWVVALKFFRSQRLITTSVGNHF